ncbi:hypothetical protein [Pontibacillus halophilus]|nr:hypothetical protein [Pontibacillus halophilus]
MEQVGQARNDKEDTITKLQSFDQCQTKDISALDSSVDALKSRVETLQNVVQEATIQVNNQNQAVGEKQSEGNVKGASGGFWGVIKGIFEGIKDFLVDMLTGLFGVLKTLFKYYMNPELLAMDIYQAVSNPGETWESVTDVAKYAVEGVKQAWINDVVNGDAESRARFFTYGSLTTATTFVGFGAGKVSKLGALGKATQAVSKAKSTNIPYNAMKTTALQKAMADGMRKTMDLGKRNMLQVLTSRPFKDMLSMKAISDRASVALTRTRNLLRTENMKTSINKVYNEVIKGPITRTNAWAKQQVAEMSQSLRPRWEVVGDGIRTDFGRGDVSADLNYAYVKGDGDYSGRQIDGVDYGRGSDKGIDKTVKPNDVVPYRPSNSPLENHHGVMDVWAKHNVPNYISRGGNTPTVALTKEQHDATKAVYRQWLYETTGKKVGGKVDWQSVSPKEIQELTQKMFNAAKVPNSARQEYYYAFNRYNYRE